MGKYNFDKVVNRENTSCVKWDFRTRCNEKATKDGLPLWVADMDFECAQPIIDALHKRVEHKIFGYSSNDTKEYKESVYSWYKRRFNLELEKDNIFYSPGVVPAIITLIKILTNEDDKVIIQQPVYTPFELKVKNNNREVVSNSLKYDGQRYEMDFEDLREKAKDPKAKVMLLCSPHNPVGRVWKEEELRTVIEICMENDLWIISDEIHSDLIRKGNKHIPTLEVGNDYKDKIITCTAPSKTFNLAGMHLSNIIINNKKLQQQWLFEIKDKLDIGAPSPFAIASTIAAYNECEDWIDELNEYLDGNIEFIDNYLKKNLAKVKLVKPEGTYLAWLDFNGYGLNKAELEDFMFKKARVLFNQGYSFGKEGNGFVRVNAACPRYILEEAMDRIKNNL
ncbi:MAG: MalY/PatB family protein [Romboutsia sp.]|uniref:MalY/PatB family protein n=1 Tax=Romboutsia sp. TaxID=1965302 RepID=UPI003F3ABBBF